MQSCKTRWRKERKKQHQPNILHDLRDGIKCVIATLFSSFLGASLFSGRRSLQRKLWWLRHWHHRQQSHRQHSSGGGWWCARHSDDELMASPFCKHYFMYHPIFEAFYFMSCNCITILWNRVKCATSPLFLFGALLSKRSNKMLHTTNREYFLFKFYD